MKDRLKVLLILIVQATLFYIVPFVFGKRHPIRIIVSLLTGTFFLATINGIQESKTKYLYPVMTAITFVPSVFIFYKPTWLIQGIWYLVVSTAGMLLGNGIKYIYNKKKGNINE